MQEPIVFRIRNKSDREERNVQLAFLTNKYCNKENNYRNSEAIELLSGDERFTYEQQVARAKEHAIIKTEIEPLNVTYKSAVFNIHTVDDSGMYQGVPIILFAESDGNKVKTTCPIRLKEGYKEDSGIIFETLPPNDDFKLYLYPQDSTQSHD